MPFLVKPDTVRSAMVTSSTLRAFVPTTQMPLPASAQLLGAFFLVAGAGDRITPRRLVPRRVTPEAVMLTLWR